MNYKEALQSIPAPGAGCHPFLLTVANIGILSGLTQQEIISDIMANIPIGKRRVSEKEVAEAVKKAAETATAQNTEDKCYSWSEALPPCATLPNAIVEKDYDGMETVKLPSSATYEGTDDFCRYIKAVFQSDEKPSICVSAFKDNEEHWRPGGAGVCVKTADELVNTAERYKIIGYNLSYLIGDWTEAGGWIRINPMDGNGCSDNNVTAYRNALVECDTIPVERQLALIRKLQLPCAAIVHSGGKSVHAIVKVEAENIKDYRERYEFLVKTCISNGLPLDKGNRNPSRYSRLPGVTRGQARIPQYLIDTNCGQKSWQDWINYIADINDDYAQIETASDILENLPPLAPCVIDGILRRRHKMLVSGPSKAGKSFLLMELAVSISTGKPWLGWNVAKGKALYVNLELDSASCAHRFADICKLMNAKPAKNTLDIWNLRGRTAPMNELAPRLIRRAADKNYSIIIIDPLYKVITGDENAAAEMAKFCNYFDKIANATGAAVVICHHHSKGTQGQKKAMDRASGSGVFARDPDAMLDLIELEINKARRKMLADLWIASEFTEILDKKSSDWRKIMPLAEQTIPEKLVEYAAAYGGDIVYQQMENIRTAAENATAWRIDSILREFPAFTPKVVWFRWPVHIPDDSGIADSALAAGEMPTREQREQHNADRRTVMLESVKESFKKLSAQSKDGEVSVAELAEDIGKVPRTIKNIIQNYGALLHIENGKRGYLKMSSQGEEK